MNSEHIAVLDIGSTKAACVIAELGGSAELRVLGAAEADSKGVKKGAVVDLEEAARAVDGAVRRAQHESGVDVDVLVVALGGPDVEAVSSQGYIPIFPNSRAITRDDVLQVVNHSRRHAIPSERQQVQAVPRRFCIDGEQDVQRPIGMNGSRLEVETLLVTAETEQIEKLERAVAMTGRRVDRLVLRGLASGLGALTPKQLQSGAAVVDIGGDTTEVAVFSNGSIAFSTSLPVGGHHVTSDLAKLLKTSVSEAERLKREHGAAVASSVAAEEEVDVLQTGMDRPRALARRVLCEIIESRVREIATLTWKHLEECGARGSLGGGIALTGGGSLIAGTDVLFESVLVGEKTFFAKTKVSGPGSALAMKPEMAVALGLARFALQGAEDELTPASSNGKLKETVRTLWSLISGKS